MRVWWKKVQELGQPDSQGQERSYTLLIVPSAHSRVRKLVVRGQFLKRAIAVAGVVAFVLGLFLIDYARSLSRSAELRRLRAETAEQRAKAAQVALGLAEMENEMSRLRNLEGRLRTAFDLDSGLLIQDPATGVGGGKTGQGPRAGIGGSDEKTDKPPLGIGGGKAGQEPHTGSGGSDEKRPEPRKGVKDGETSLADTDGSLDERRRDLEALVDIDLGRMKERARAQEQSFAQLVGFLEDRKSQLACTPSIMPVSGFVSSGFQRRTDPFTGNTVWHRGLDISTDYGTPVRAPADGIVNFTGHQVDLGTLVSLDHGYGYLTRFGHNSKIVVQVGQKVQRGQVIAYVGNTGKSTGPHLHYEVLRNGLPVNPQDYIIN